MSKTLTKEQPSSYVRSELLSAAIGATREQTVAVRVTPAGDGTRVESHDTTQQLQRGEPADIRREFMLTRSLDAFVSQTLTSLYRNATGARLNPSTIARCIAKALWYALPELERQAAMLGQMKLPAKGDHEARERFEDAIVQAMLTGLRAWPGYSRRRE